MGNSLVTIFATLIGVIVGSGITLSVEYLKKRGVCRKYSVVFSFELQQLKSELNHVLDDYEQLELSQTGRNTRVVPQLDPIEFLLKWDFSSKYPFLTENFEKLSLFDEETIKSIIKIHSLLMEYEILKNRHDNVILVDNLRKAQTELDHAISLLQRWN